MSNAHSSSHPTWQTLTEFNLPSQLGINRLARDYVVAAVYVLNLSAADLKRLTTAVDEAVQNAIEQSNRHRPNLPVTIRVRVSNKAVTKQITDQGDASIPDPETSELTKKGSEQEPSQGWGFFLIERVENDTQTTCEDRHHSVELFLYLE